MARVNSVAIGVFHVPIMFLVGVSVPVLGFVKSPKNPEKYMAPTRQPMIIATGMTVLALILPLDFVPVEGGGGGGGWAKFVNMFSLYWTF